jgi:hypothetical protein
MKRFDEAYWGPGGVDLSRWGAECARGVPYAETTGSPKLSVGRKSYRGLVVARREQGLGSTSRYNPEPEASR